MVKSDGVETPELVDLQDVFAKTSTEVINELPSDSEVSDSADLENDGDLLSEGQKKLPEALQKHILSRKKEEGEEGEETTTPLDIKEALSDDGESTDGEAPEDSMFQNPVEQDPPAGEFHEPVVEISETPINNRDKYAEVYAAHAMSQRIASMPLAEYEGWLFPQVGSPDHLRGQMCLARIEASLKAANGGHSISDLWQIKIGAALWSRLHYREGDAETTRQEVEKAPPMELIPLIPKNASEAISVIEEMQASNIESGSQIKWWGVVGACAAAIVVPVFFLRRG